ncbi:hypothetical protein PhCBS80983_g01095 [Powellomyces hirtus]|uniref:Uncharacterized protein n=1 Tax=Powellomyces hirtus TaxID=109895 RepID=A0A507ECG1_9FUNG|nr:hypothetical protein PhCBS80983_g01095 [Powellomyces hirtus]
MSLSHDEGLAHLISVFDTRYSEETLLKALKGSQGDVAGAIDVLLIEEEIGGTNGVGSISKKRGISDFFAPKSPKKKAVRDKTERDGGVRADCKPPDTDDNNTPRRNAFELLGKKVSETEGKVSEPPKQLTIHNIREHVPCELFFDVLPETLANELLQRLLVEAKTWEFRRFVLFDREVVSPHSTSFYAEDAVSQSTPSAPFGVPDTDYYYGGRRTSDVRPLFPEMVEARTIIEECVNIRLLARDAAAENGRHFAELRGRWRPNIVVANRYRGHNEGVGAHTDKLTYIGPRPTIGSLTLGAARPFRLRRLARPHSPAQTYNVVLPHNSLLIMFPPMQEEYRHEVPKCNPKHLTPHPISHDVRINLTYRVARPEYRSSIPVCKCGNPTELRTVLKQAHSLGRYFYMCAGGGNEVNGVKAGHNCGTFVWLDLEKKSREAAVDGGGRPEEKVHVKEEVEGQHDTEGHEVDRAAVVENAKGDAIESSFFRKDAEPGASTNSESAR